jgi:hypothetical protein
VGTLTVVVLLAGAFNVCIDPLNVFGAPRVLGLNAVKPHLDHHRELTRWRIAVQYCPNAVILGNSRSEIGLDPEHSDFARRGLNAVNLAIPGTDATTAYQQLVWLQSIGCMPKVVVLGVEFFDFLGAAPAKRLSYTDPTSPPKIDAAFFAEAVFSLTGLGDSLNTVSLQRARYPATLTDRGFNPLRNYVLEVAQGGHYTLFRQRALENAKNWGRKAPQIHTAGGGPSEDAVAVRSVLDLASSAGSTVHVVIYPYHAQIRLMLMQMGLNDLFAQWKRDITQMAESRQQGTTANPARVKVWDFSGLSAETLETIPLVGDRETKLNFFWEAGHFKKELGDKLLSRVLGDDNGFGIQLGPNMLSTWLAQDEAAVRRLMDTPSALRDESLDVVTRAAAARPAD